MLKSLFRMTLAGGLFLAGLACSAAAQDMQSSSQEPSLADAARKARAAHKNEAPPKQVWDDDNLPKAPKLEPSPAASNDKPAAQGGEKGAAQGGDKAAQKPTEGAAEDDSKKDAALEAQWRAKFADAHKKLDADQRDLDLMQREYSVKQQQYYSDPNTAMRQQYNQYAGGRGTELNDLQQKIDQRKQDIVKDQQAIDNLEAELRQQGLPSGWAR